MTMFVLMDAPLRGVPLIAAAIIGAVFLLACTPLPSVDGRALFSRECSGCHGNSGDGDGALAVFVRTGVPNLRKLSQRNGGTFPEHHAVAVVTRVSDFHEDVVAMPDFGDLLQAAPATYTAPDGEVIQTNRSVLDIVAYLKSIQS